MGDEAQRSDLDNSAHEELVKWLEADFGRENVEPMLASLNPRSCSEVGLKNATDWRGQLDRLPAPETTEDEEAEDRADDTEVKTKRSFVQWATPMLLGMAADRWAATKVAEDFDDPPEVWRILFEYIVAPQADRLTMEEFGAKLAMMASRSTAFNVDDVKYRLATVLQKLREALGDFVLRYPQEIIDAGGDPEHIEKMIPLLKMRPIRKVINDRSDRRE